MHIYKKVKLFSPWEFGEVSHHSSPFNHHLITINHDLIIIDHRLITITT